MREKSQKHRRSRQAPAHKVTVAMTAQLPAVTCRPVYIYWESVLFPGTIMKWDYFSQYSDKYFFIILVTKSHDKYQSTMRFAKLWKCSAILSPRIFADLHSKTGHLYLSLLGWKGPGKGPVLFNPFLFNVMFETNTKLLTSNHLHTLFNTGCVFLRKSHFVVSTYLASHPRTFLKDLNNSNFKVMLH